MNQVFYSFLIIIKFKKQYKSLAVRLFVPYPFPDLKHSIRYVQSFDTLNGEHVYTCTYCTSTGTWITSAEPRIADPTATGDMVWSKGVLTGKVRLN